MQVSEDSLEKKVLEIKNRDMFRVSEEKKECREID